MITFFNRFSKENMSLKSKIFIRTTIYSIIILLIFFIYIYHFNRKFVENQLSNRIYNELNSCAELINGELSLYVQRSNIILKTPYIFEKIQETNLNLYDTMTLNDNFRKIFLGVDPLEINGESAFKIFILSKEKKTSSPYIDYIGNLQDNASNLDIINSISNDPIWVPTVTSNNNNEQYITFYRNITLIPTKIGVLRVNIPLNKITYYFNRTMPNEEIIISYIDSSEKTIYNYAKKSDSNQKLMDFNNYFKFSKQLINGHKITILYPRSELNNEYNKIFIYIVISIILFFLPMLYFSSMISKFSTKELHKFINDFNNINLINEEIYDVEIKGSSELFLIKHEFYGLITKIKNMYTEVNSLKSQKRAIELELLNSKLNPHLLFNSLSVIKWTAIRNNDENTIGLIDSLIIYYRSVLSKGDNIISVKNEILMMQQYIKVMNYTYASIEYNLETKIRDDIEHCYIMKLLFQPFIENAILHGVDKTTKSVNIEISGYFEDENTIIFIIKDNGPGMNEELIYKILNFEHISRKGGYGIKNVIQRIKLCFGDEYGVTIASSLGYGTEITIRIPKTSEETLKLKLLV